MRADRHAYGLRARDMRRLHRVARRRPGARLLDFRGADGGQRDPNHRKSRRGRPADAAAARFRRPSRRAMRLLHTGLPDARHRHHRIRPRHRRRGPARSAVGEFVPLHRLSRHCRRSARRTRRNARRSRSMNDASPPGRVLGRSVPRLEDPPLLTGRGQFVGDISFPHQLHMRVVRAPYAHAELRAIDTTAALAAPGVVAVWTGTDLADLPPIDFRDPAGEGLRPYRQPLLAKDRLRYVGESVAAVFATDPYLAEDAADLVVIEADELPPLLHAEAAAA